VYKHTSHEDYTKTEKKKGTEKQTEDKARWYIKSIVNCKEKRKDKKEEGKNNDEGIENIQLGKESNLKANNQTEASTEEGLGQKKSSNC
jgi:hypothetical protein